MRVYIPHGIIATLLAIMLFSCEAPEQKKATAQNVLKKALISHGLYAKDQFELSFNFRERLYKARRDGGAFDYYRIFSDSSGQEVIDHLSNSGFVRTVGSDTLGVPKEKAHAYGESVNSVIYFALLPYFLQDPAVQLELLGEASIKNSDYYKIRVTFKKEGGGSDHDDIFVYWFNKDSGHMDYLAYSYSRDGGGVRFREAVNKRIVGNVRFADYINYKHSNPKFPVEQCDSAFESGQLEKLSEIVLENIEMEAGEEL